MISNEVQRNATRSEDGRLTSGCAAEPPPEHGLSGLECRNVTLSRRMRGTNSHPILVDVCARFMPHALCLVFGRTGAGKSSLLHLLAGMLRPTSGEVLAEGQSISRFVAEHRARWRKNVGISFQRPELLLDLTVLENVIVPLIPRDVSRRELQQRAHSAMERLDLTPLGQRAAGSLSLGERQRVAFARALVASPRYLLVDEPTAHQDDAGAERMLQILEEEAARGASVVVVTHDPRLRRADTFKHRWELAEGRLRAQPTKEHAAAPGSSTEDTLDSSEPNG